MVRSWAGYDDVELRWTRVFWRRRATSRALSEEELKTSCPWFEEKDDIPKNYRRLSIEQSFYKYLFDAKKNMFWRFLCHGNPLRHQNRKSDPLRHHSRKKSKLIRGARRGMTLSFQFHRFTRFTLCASLSAAATLRCLSTNSYFCCVYYTGTYLV